MSRKLFVNLPVSDLKRSIDFFTQLGFTFDPQFTDDSATCMLLSDEAFVMLLVEPRFSDFVTKQICDTTTHTEVIMCVSADSRDEVDELVHKALAAGGKPSNDPIDHGFMYGWSFQDPDGHLWELMYMDPTGMPEQ